MLIGLCGGICSGKNSIADYLIQTHEFTRLYLPPKPVTPLVENETEDGRLALSIYSDQQPSPKHGNALSFLDVEALLDHVTKRWREHFVTTDIWDDAALDLLLRRPFFLLVSVDAPVSLRWKRFSDRCRARSVPPPSLESFVLWSDRHLYSPSPSPSFTNSNASSTPSTSASTLGLAHPLSRAHLRLLNPSTTLPTLHASLASVNLTDASRLRPSWDQYFMRLASLAASRSNCMKRRVGCVLVSATRRVISTGYNGTPRNVTNCSDGGCVRCNAASSGGTALSTCLCLHAEENALLEAGRERIRDGTVLYCDTCPCLTCAVKIVQVGISEVVYSQSYNMDLETAMILSEGGVKLRQFSPPSEGVVSLGLGMEGLRLE